MSGETGSRPRIATGGLAQQGWRDAIAPVERHPNGAGIVREDGSAPEPPLADADSQAVAVAALDALARLDAGGGWDDRAAALRARLSAWGAGDDGRGGRRPAGARCRLPARLAAVGGRARAGGGGGRGRAAHRPGRAHAARAADALVRAPGVRPRRLPPRRRLAVRLLARLGRAARRGPRRGGRAGPRGRAVGARRARARAGALRRRRRRSGPAGRRWPTACRPGPSARAGRSSRSGTAAPRGPSARGCP